MSARGPAGHLPPLHLLLALGVMAVWGTNFVVIKLALAHLPPLTLAALRFSLAFLPMALFIKRPAVPLKNLATYGVLIGAGQFGLLFTAMRADITPGLASLVVQTQVFMTIGLSMRLTGERIAPYQIAAMALAVAGLATIGWHSDGSATPLGLLLVLGAALSWSLGNMTARAAGPVSMLNYVVWSSVFAVPPLFVMALLTEGWPRMAAGVAAADWTTWGAVVWQRWAIRCSAMPPGAGCWASIRPRRSPHWRCWCRSLASVPRHCCWVSRCKGGKSRPSSWS